jgi:dTDP-4-dehydrorhamnose reductase
MARLLITGSSGLLGLNLALDAMTSHEVIGVDRSRLKSVPFQTIQADLLVEGAVDSVLDEARPDWLIHCAALADLEACEADPDLARRLNADLPRALAKACRSRGLPLVQISTDAVFDGTKSGSYVEADTPNPVSAYARTKLDGENHVLGEYPESIVARVNFYGWSLGGRRSLAEFFFHNLTEDKSMSGYTDVIFCPMHVTHLGRTLLAMLEKRLHGLYHAVGPEPMSKYQFGMEIARRFGLDASAISPRSIHTSRLVARRSNNLYLSTDKLSTDLSVSLPNFSTGLDLFYQQYQDGYPQKLRSYAQ